MEVRLPPAINTLPSGNRVAVCHNRAVIMLPVGTKVPVSGSYNSALATESLKAVGETPPAIKTLPSASKVAVFHQRAVIIVPVGVKVPAVCAIAVDAWLRSPSKKSARTRWISIDRLTLLGSGHRTLLIG